MKPDYKNELINSIRRNNKLLFRQTSLKFTFIKGIVYGFGAFIGATIMITIILSILARLQFVPIIGKFATDIVEIVNSNIADRNSNQERSPYPYK